MSSDNNKNTSTNDLTVLLTGITNKLDDMSKRIDNQDARITNINGGTPAPRVLDRTKLKVKEGVLTRAQQAVIKDTRFQLGDRSEKVQMQAYTESPIIGKK